MYGYLAMVQLQAANPARVLMATYLTVLVGATQTKRMKVLGCIFAPSPGEREANERPD